MSFGKKHFLGFFLIVSSFILHHSSFTQTCLPSNRSFYGYTFLNMNILPEDQRNTLAPLFLRFDKLYRDYFQTVEQANRDDNLAEWHARFCGEVDTADLEYIIYKASVNDLDLLLTATESKSLQIPPSLQDNTFAEFVFDKRCPETVRYLIFAKRCEPHVTLNDQWQAVSRDTQAMRALIREGKRYFTPNKGDEKYYTKSAYIRLRFAYQIIRLAHYVKDYELTLKLCDELLPQVDKQLSKWELSIIPWWIEGHRAGALRSLGRNVEASYLYAKIFQKCPGRRASAYQSFFIKTDQEWEDCLRMCQSDAERATLYAIRAASEESHAVEEMEKIYQLDPLNSNLEVLLVQEIRKMERNLLGLEFNPRQASNQRFHQIPKSYAGNYVISLQRFVRKVRQEGKAPRLSLWRIAEGYLEFLAGDFYAAEKTFHEAASDVNDKVLAEQLAVFRLALQIAAFEKPTAEVEETAYEILTDNKLYSQYKSFPNFLQDKMAHLFRQFNQEGKAFLSQHTLSELKPNPSLEMLDNLIAAALKPQPSSFERLLMERNPVNDVLDIKAVMLMNHGQFEAAFETYKRIPADLWDNYGNFNPFRETTKDCINCLQRADTSTVISSLNRGELIEAILDLEYKAKGDLEGAARHYYRLGLAYYNISYFGFEWRGMDFFRSGSTWEKLHRGENQVYSHWKYPIGNHENTDISKAFYAFEKARLLAADPELAARAAFQAARCEQKLWFMNENYKPEPCCNRIPRLPEEYLVNFSRLKELYSGTEFYRQVVTECKYFEVYSRR
ncbi:MAG: hypothetical protein AAB316_02975 [Bacteroidota bacterium]